MRYKGLQSGNNVNKETEPNAARSSFSELDMLDDYINKVRFQEEHNRYLLNLDDHTRNPLVSTTERQLFELHISAILDKEGSNQPPHGSLNNAIDNSFGSLES